MTQIKRPPNSQPAPPQTLWGKRTERFLLQIGEPINLVGHSLMGSYWKTLHSSVQDAIALGLILKIPGAIGEWVMAKSFTGFDVCLQQNILSVDRYACFIIVASDFCLWIVIAGRTIARFWIDWNELKDHQ
jgi:hypothetical protein